MKVTQVKLAKLNFDYSLYPRQDVSSIQISDMVDALAAGEEFPPIIVEKGTNCVVDGWHRAKAHLRFYKDDANATIDAFVKKYPNEKERYLDAVRLNAKHGRRFAPNDKTKALVCAQELGIELVTIAKALNITVERAEEICVEKTATLKTPGGTKQVAIKRTVRHIRGKVITKRQAEVVTKLGGMEQAYYCNQLIILLETGLINKESSNVIERLVKLHELLEGFLTAKMRG